MLCAPRPVFVSSGSQEIEGGWVDAKGMFLGATGASPVHELLGKRGLGTNEFPPMAIRRSFLVGSGRRMRQTIV